MTLDDLKYLKDWFSGYTKSFYSSDEDDQRNIMLKVVHTENVCRNIVEIAKRQGLDENRVMLAETAALFHDIGRFPQYARYKTFRDADSVSHGRLGAETLIKEGILDGLPDDEKDLIIYTVRFHGAFSMPNTQDPERQVFLKLVRDADKVDIFRVFLKYYESPKEERASATAFGVPDIPEYSKSMLSCILKGQIASYSNIKTENDFKLMQLSWIYDMNFNESLKMLEEKKYLKRIIAKLPQTDEINSAMEYLLQYVEERTANG